MIPLVARLGDQFSFEGWIGGSGQDARATVARGILPAAR